MMFLWLGASMDSHMSCDRYQDAQASPPAFTPLHERLRGPILEGVLDQQAKPWTRFATCKPPHGQLVLVYSESFRRDNCTYDANYWLGRWWEDEQRWSLPDDEVGCRDHITKWMEIPK